MQQNLNKGKIFGYNDCPGWHCDKDGNERQIAKSRIQSNTLKATNGTLCVDTKTIYFYTLELFVEKRNWKQSAH